MLSVAEFEDAVCCAFTHVDVDRKSRIGRSGRKEVRAGAHLAIIGLTQVILDESIAFIPRKQHRDEATRLVLCSDSIFGYDGLPVRLEKSTPTDWKSVVRFNSTLILIWNKALGAAVLFGLNEGHTMVSVEKLQKAKQDHQSWLNHTEGFGGVGIGVDSTSTPCLIIYSNRMSRQTKESIRDKLGKTPCQFEEIGHVRKQLE